MYGIIGFAGLCVLALVFLAGRAKLRPLWFALALAVAAAACGLAVAGTQRGVIYSRYATAPEETVDAFFTDLLSDDYEGACALLDNYSDLGMSVVPEDPTTAALYAALHESYACRPLGQARTSGLSAVQEVSFTALDIPALQADLREQVLLNLARFVEERPYNAVYDEQDQYRPEVTDEAYRDAVQTLLEHSSDYERTEVLPLTLRYSTQGWSLVADANLLNALNGYLQ